MLLDRARSQLLLVDIQDRLQPAIHEGVTVVRNATRLLEASRTLLVPIIASEQYPQGLGHIVGELQPLLPGNAVYEKVEFSCFANAALRNILSGAGKQTIVFGTEAHVCVLQTVLEMKDAGCDVTVVVDAVGSRAIESKDVALLRMADAGVRLATTEMVLFEWLRRAGTPEFKAISRLIR
jgi:nicotinamidase-related amidase